MRRSSIFLTLVQLTVGLTVAQTTPPDVLNYQGVLRDASDAPLDGTYPMVFRFFDAAASGNEILVDEHFAIGHAITVILDVQPKAQADRVGGRER